MLVAGRLIEGEGSPFSVIDPATEVPFATVKAASPAQVDEAVAAAKAAFPAWAALGLAQRRAALAKIAEITKAHHEELASLLLREQGKPMPDAMFEIGATAGMFEYHGHVPNDLLAPTPVPGSEAVLHRVPLGVVAAILPWNYPLALMAFKLPGALLAGNTVVLKPAPTTPLTTLRWAALVAQALPAGVLNVLADGGEVGPLLTAHPDVRKISFTGSTATGRQVLRSSAGDLKRVTLELGGNDPAVVLPDADLDAVAGPIFDAAFMNNGQTCAAIKRVYVHASQHDALVRRLAERAEATVVGEGTQPGVKLGPLQNKRQFELVKELLADAVAQGAVVEAGGQPPQPEGYFLRPTILSGVHDGQRIVDEEQFGPVLPVLRYTDLDAVIGRVNDSPYGLGASVWGSDSAALQAVAQRIEAGSVWINKHFPVAPNVPFGGARQSGIGAELGAQGLLEFTQLKVVA
jgi:acyl-CoA reductase-like NAD-dependent aldehyde dehydrogenase